MEETERKVARYAVLFGDEFGAQVVEPAEEEIVERAEEEREYEARAGLVTADYERLGGELRRTDFPWKMFMAAVNRSEFSEARVNRSTMEEVIQHVGGIEVEDLAMYHPETLIAAMIWRIERRPEGLTKDSFSKFLSRFNGTAAERKRMEEIKEKNVQKLVERMREAGPAEEKRLKREIKKVQGVKTALLDSVDLLRYIRKFSNPG